MARRKQESTFRQTVPRYALRLTGVALILTALGLLAPEGEMPPPASAQDARPADQQPAVGYLVRVPLPIAGNADRNVKTQISRILEKRQAGDRPVVIVLELDAREDESGEGSEYGRTLEIARFLTSDKLGGVRTVAYIPRRLTGHALMVAMACQEIAMGDEAELGAPGDKGQRVTPGEIAEYEELYRQRQTLPAAVALGMLDPSLAVYRADVKDGKRWVLPAGLEELEDQPGFAGYETIVKKGDLGNFTAKELRSYGFVSRTVANQQELAGALKVGKFSDDPNLGDGWNAIQVDLHGAINRNSVNQTLRILEDTKSAAQRQGAPVNFLLLNIDSGGGSAPDAIKVINVLDEMDPAELRTVAYVAGIARADASTILFACDEVAVHPDAVLGGSGERVLSQLDIEDLTERLKRLSEERSGHWSPWAAMIDETLELHQYTRQGGGQTAYFCKDELTERADADQWVQGAQVVGPNELLKVSGAEALEMGLVDHTVNDHSELLTVYDLEDSPQMVRPNWAHKLLDQVKSQPWLPGFLMFVGTFALMSEISSPGLGLAGLIALICFLLFFWLKVLDGTAGALEILLFFAGVACIALEMFVLPGFGIFGLAGGAMVIASLVLASQTFVIPRNDYQFEQLPGSLFTVVAAGAGVFIGIVVVRKYIDKAPGLRRIMLSPLTAEDNAEVAERESLAHYGYLNGKLGKTVTQLTPSGKARFGDQLVDVITDGEVVAKEAEVKVVDVQGNIVVVAPVDEGAAS